MSVSEKTWGKCCRWSLIFSIIAILGIALAIYKTTPEVVEEKNLWMEKAIHNIQKIKPNELYSKPAYLSIHEFKEEITEILFEEKNVEHDSVRGIYITAGTAASKNFMDIIDTLIKSGGNSVVIDLELSGGQLAFTPESEYLKTINPGSTMLDNLKSIIKELHRKDIYVIARQVVFNDPYTASRKPEWRIHHTGGSLFDGRWLDPSHPEVQTYNLIITREAAELGFDEIQYDYIRFPDGYHRGLDYYYDETTMERWEVINNYLKKAHLITEEYGIKLGMDVFGATIYGNLDWSLVGQYIPEVAKSVDVIYPMVYPSHISPGYNGFTNPYGAPYAFINDSIGKFIAAADGNAEIRTWVQGFPLRIPNFGPWFVQEQVRGTYDAGANGFVIWSPGNIYSSSWSSLGMIPPEPPEPLHEPISNSLIRITKKPFGLKVSPDDSPVSPEKFSGYHTGTDFEILEGEEDSEVDVFAVCDGTLMIKRSLSGYGGVAVQSCQYGSDDITVVYGHLKLSSITSEANDTIKKGQKLAILGKDFSKETDNERKHLHLGIYKGKEINFLGYVLSEKELNQWMDPKKIITYNSQQ